MGCCQRNEEYKCAKCGMGMKVTEEPKTESEKKAPSCPCCGSEMEKCH